MNLQQYLYEYMQQGGRNPGVLKKFVTYLEMNNVEITEYPRVIEQFLDELGFAKTTKRNYKSSCNNFLTYVYAREGLSLPNKTQTLKEQEGAVRIEDDTITIKSTATIKEVKQYTTLTRNKKNNTYKEKQKPEKTKQEKEEEMVIDEEYGEFLRKYERLCENG